MTPRPRRRSPLSIPIGRVTVSLRSIPRVDPTPAVWTSRIIGKTVISTRHLIVGLPLLSTVAHAGSFYVSPTGNNTNPGNSNLPWKTLQYAADQLRPGDTV